MSYDGQGAVLAFDLGNKCGVATVCGGRFNHQTINFTPERHEGYGFRFYRFRRWLTEEKARLGGEIDFVYFEDVMFGNKTKALQVYGGYAAILTAWCEHFKIPYQGIAVATIKRFITGSGSGGKSSVIDAVKQLGFSPASDHEADAIALLLLGIEQLKAEYVA